MLYPQHPRVLLALAETPQLCKPFLGSSSCLACLTCLGLPSALQVPRAVSLFSHVASGQRLEPGVSPSLYPREKVCLEKAESCWDYVPCHRCPRRLPPTCPYRGKTGGAGWSVLRPPPLDTLGRKGECQSFGARGA